MKPRIPFHFHLITLFILIFTFAFILASCDTSEPVNNKQLTLTVEDASSTEVWVGLKTNSFSLPVSGMIKINSLAKKAVTISSSDTVIYIDSLSPNTAYKLQAELSGISSSEVTVTTMDTTSHNFTWQTYTFGGANGSSVLNDVAIINENNIWAVGEIHTAETDQFDSNGVWVDPYNAVHWDGNTWELKRIIVNFRGNSIFIPLEGIFAFSSNDIWVVGSLPIHGDGNNWRIYDVREITNSNLSLSKAWGTSSNNMYFVGRGGSIAHYNGSPSADGWTKIKSGTELDIYDIRGDYNKKNGDYEILAVASKILQSTDRDILKISNTGVAKLDEIGINWSLHGIWFKNSRKYYAVGSGIYRKNKMSDKKWDNKWQQITQYYINSVRGTEINDVFMCGAFGEVLHYNGKSWYSYLNKGLPYFNGSMVKLSYKRNKVCIVGSDGRFGIIYLGTKS